MTLMINCLANLAEQVFNLSSDALIDQIYNRIEHFPTLDSYEQISKAIAHQIIWEIEKKRPSETMPPMSLNTISFEADLMSRNLMIGMKHDLPALHQTWTNTLLRPACFIETLPK